MKEGDEMDCPLQTVHLCLQEQTLGKQHCTQYGAAKKGCEPQWPEVCGMPMPWQSTEHTPECVECDRGRLQGEKHANILCLSVPLVQFSMRRSAGAIKMYNGLLNSNCETLRKVLKADLHLHSRAPSCWTAHILDGFQGLRRCESFVTAMKQGAPISLQDFTDDLRHRLHGAWRAVEGVDSQTTNNKLPTCHAA
eukprot:1154059-Pelagomonas_calceolata.AAC.2